MNNTKKTLVYVAVFLAAVNLLLLFFSWAGLHVTFQFDIPFMNYQENHKTTINILKGIDLPSVVPGLILPFLYIYLILKSKRSSYIAGVSIFLNGAGYAMGHFINSGKILSFNLIDNHAVVNLNSELLPFFYLYLSTALIICILPFFIFTNK